MVGVVEGLRLATLGLGGGAWGACVGFFAIVGTNVGFAVGTFGGIVGFGTGLFVGRGFIVGSSVGAILGAVVLLGSGL